MYRSQKTRRPVFITRAMEERQNRELDARLERQDRERQERLNATIAASQAQKSPEQLASDAAELSRLDAIATEESRRREERLRQRRTIDQFSTIGT
jgi:hypothetical protein